MANKKITELNALTDVADADLLAMVDDPSGSAETKKIVVSDSFLRWGMRKSVSPPVSTDFAWVNQDTATVSDSAAGMHLYVPAVGGNDGRLLVKAIPSAPYTVTCGIIAASYETSWNAYGIALRASGSGTFVFFGALAPAARIELVAQKWTNETSSAGYYSNVASYFCGDAVWFRVQDNSTNRILSWSVDGVNFVQFHSVSRTDYITPDQICVYGQTNNATYDLGITVIDWSEA